MEESIEMKDIKVGMWVRQDIWNEFFEVGKVSKDDFYLKYYDEIEIEDTLARYGLNDHTKWFKRVEETEELNEKENNMQNKETVLYGWRKDWKQGLEIEDMDDDFVYLKVPGYGTLEYDLNDIIFVSDKFIPGNSTEKFTFEEFVQAGKKKKTKKEYKYRENALTPSDLEDMNQILLDETLLSAMREVYDICQPTEWLNHIVSDFKRKEYSSYDEWVEAWKTVYEYISQLIVDTKHNSKIHADLVILTNTLLNARAWMKNQTGSKS